MKLTTREARILLALQFNADATVPEIAKQTRLPAHVIHYAQRKLKEEGVIRKGAFLDLYRLGFEQYMLIFSLSVQGKTRKKRIIDFLVSHPRVAWFAELGGNFQYALVMYASSGSHAYEFLEETVARFGEIFLKKEISLVVSFHLFQKSYLAPGRSKKATKRLTTGHSTDRVEIDSLDATILAALFNQELTSHREMARALGVARTTLEYRLRKLEQKEVVKAHLYYISAKKIGMQIFKLLIYSRGLASTLGRNLLDFCAKDPHIVNLTQSLGAWDYELTVETPSTQTMLETVERIYLSYGEMVNDIEVLPIFSQTTSKNFLAQLPDEIERLKAVA